MPSELGAGELAVTSETPAPERDPLQCPDCDKPPFKNRAGLASHTKNVHGTKAPPKPKADQAPASVVLNLGGDSKKKDPDLEAVEARAKQLVGLIAALVLLAGQADDAVDLQKGSEAWAKTVAELAEYEPWLKKLAAGGEMAGRTAAWISLVVATAALALPILVRHEALPAQIAAFAEMLLPGGAQIHVTAPNAGATV